MTSFSVTVTLCKDPDTGSPWLHLPHVSSWRGCAPAPHSLLTPWCLSSTRVSWQPPSRWDFYPNCPRSFQWEWEAVPLLPTTPNTGMGSQLYSMFCPGSLSTFYRHIVHKKIHKWDTDETLSLSLDIGEKSHLNYSYLQVFTNSHSCKTGKHCLYVIFLSSLCLFYYGGKLKNWARVRLVRNMTTHFIIL